MDGSTGVARGQKQGGRSGAELSNNHKRMCCLYIKLFQKRRKLSFIIELRPAKREAVEENEEKGRKGWKGKEERGVDGRTRTMLATVTMMPSFSRVTAGPEPFRHFSLAA